MDEDDFEGLLKVRLGRNRYFKAQPVTDDDDQIYRSTETRQEI